MSSLSPISSSVLSTNTSLPTPTTSGQLWPLQTPPTILSNPHPQHPNPPFLLPSLFSSVLTETIPSDQGTSPSHMIEEEGDSDRRSRFRSNPNLVHRRSSYTDVTMM
ncbi:unnamed protein product [Lactuca virosa]|uniref:Uncharacterized protein n=1 Tax=Lactuca virosa TaxID=75947 RepID=A0AAU9MHW7_9ASTR|nr:unnamed protein product [Lactuca virosa]